MKNLELDDYKQIRDTIEFKFNISQLTFKDADSMNLSFIPRHTSNILNHYEQPAPTMNNYIQKVIERYDIRCQNKSIHMTDKLLFIGSEVIPFAKNIDLKSRVSLPRDLTRFVHLKTSWGNSIDIEFRFDNLINIGANEEISIGRVTIQIQKMVESLLRYDVFYEERISKPELDYVQFLFNTCVCAINTVYSLEEIINGVIAYDTRK